MEAANIINSAKENLKKLEEIPQTEDMIYKNAIISRQMGELAAAGYNLNQLKTGKYGKKAGETLGDIYKSLNNQHKAIDEYRKVINSGDGSPSAYVSIANAMMFLSSASLYAQSNWAYVKSTSRGTVEILFKANSGIYPPYSI